MSDEEGQAALRTLAEASGDPGAWMLAHALLDDESESERDRAAVEAARRELATLEPAVTLEQVKRELGLR